MIVYRMYLIPFRQQRQPTSKPMINDGEWIDLVRWIIHRPLEDELKSLLDRYKTVNLNI